MWFIFIAVLIVVAVMLVFLLMAIRLLASQAKQSLDGYFMKNLEVYEELEENLSLRTKELQGQIDGQEKKLDILQKKQARMEEMTSAVRGRKEMAGCIPGRRFYGGLLLHPQPDALLHRVHYEKCTGPDQFSGR